MRKLVLLNKMNDIVTDNNSKSLFLPIQTLQGYGCVNCVWKNYGQCPKGFTEPEDKLPDGYCTELVNFIFSLASTGDSISAVKEKFFIYTQEMQAMADGSEFQRLFKEYKKFKTERHPQLTHEEIKEKLASLQSSMASFKGWWFSLTESVVKGLSRIADREGRRKEIGGVQKVTIEQFNVLLRESDDKLKQLE